MSRRFLLLMPVMLAAMPAPVFAQAAEQSGDLVVTARSLAETARALEECLARNCPPDEDVRATLAHAENLFVEGDYRDARETMLSSLRRNREHSGEYPVEVSDLLRANARVAAHLGEVGSYQHSLIDMRDILRDSFGDNDPRVLVARIEVADGRARQGYRNEARDMYIDIAREADGLDLPRVAGFARIRAALIDLPSNREQRVASRVRDAQSILAAVAASADRVGSDLALLADVMLARIEREEGNTTRTDALLARFANSQGTNRPLLISGDPIRLVDADTAESRSDGSGNTLNRVQTNVDNRWVDVGFWVNADGRVSDFEILRSEGGTGWADAVERSIRSRQYTPMRSTNGVPAQGLYMVERYTLTADFDDNCTGTHIRCRSPRLRVERMDLTVADSATG